MGVLSDFILGLRIETDDNTTSKFIFNEDLIGQVNGSNKLFFLSERNIVTGSAVVYADGVLKTITTDYTIDLTKGLITFGTAPSVSVMVSYYWNDFTDTDYTSFVYNGLQHIGYSTGSANIEADLTNTPESLRKAVEHYSLFHCYSTLSTKTARLFSAGAGKKNINKDNIAKKYESLAEFHEKQASIARDDYYKRQGRRYAPAYGHITVASSSYTPRR